MMKNERVYANVIDKKQDDYIIIQALAEEVDALILTASDYKVTAKFWMGIAGVSLTLNIIWIIL